MSQVFIADQTNLDSLSKFFKTLNTEHYDFSDIKPIQAAIDKQLCFVMKTENKITAAMILKIDEQNCEIYLLRSTVKNGGRTLIQYTEKLCRERNIPKIWCWSLARYNVSGFYDKMGFAECLLMRNQWYNEDCYIFGKVLS